jgi:5-oxoprolinase (ATP-hydrolysing)
LHVVVIVAANISNRSRAMSSWQFWIDRGGTFTDIVARHPNGELSTLKLLSENPERYRDAAIAGIKSVLGIPLDAPIPLGTVEAVKMGTTELQRHAAERSDYAAFQARARSRVA